MSEQGKIDEKMMKKLLDMGLHETMTVGEGRTVVRVPRGWIYETFNPETGALATTFIPIPKSSMIKF